MQNTAFFKKLREVKDLVDWSGRKSIRSILVTNSPGAYADAKTSKTVLLQAF